jgi:hypothetical protein
MISWKKWQIFSGRRKVGQVDKEQTHVSHFLQHILYVIFLTLYSHYAVWPCALPSVCYLTLHCDYYLSTQKILFQLVPWNSVTQTCDQVTWCLKSGTWHHMHHAWLCIDCAHSRQDPKKEIIERSSGTRGKCLVISGTSCILLPYMYRTSHRSS